MALQEEFESQGLWLFRYRSFIPIIILVIGIGLYAYSEWQPDTFCLRQTPYECWYEMAAFAIGILGLVIRVYTVGFTPKNTSGRNTSEGQVADTVNQTGIYSIVRHPLYLGNYFMWLAPALLPGNFWFAIAFTLFYWVYYERIMYAEEQFLRKKFGDIYVQWAAKTPAFIPNFSQFVPSNLHFSWRKILKKEKNGLFALFIIFAVCDAIGEWIKGTYQYNYFFLIGTLVTALLYVVLKYLKYNTNVLNEEGR